MIIANGIMVPEAIEAGKALAEAGIEKRFVNKTLDETKQELMDYIRSYVG